jgi:hypothetical protein
MNTLDKFSTDATDINSDTSLSDSEHFPYAEYV